MGGPGRFWAESPRFPVGTFKHWVGGFWRLQTTLQRHTFPAECNPRAGVKWQPSGQPQDPWRSTEMAVSGSRAREGLWALRTFCPLALASASRAHQLCPCCPSSWANPGPPMGVPFTDSLTHGVPPGWLKAGAAHTRWPLVQGNKAHLDLRRTAGRVLLSGAPCPDLAPGCFHDWGLRGHFYRC